jgi:sec-independent protein translocase protein TatA
MLAEIFGLDGVVVIAVLAVVLFGGSRIPKLARSLGSAQKEFKQGLQEGAKASDVGETNVTAERIL